MKFEIKSILNCILHGILLSIVAIFISFTISYLFNFNLTDSLFIVGIVLVLFGILASLNGNSMGLSLNELGSSGAQFISRANLEVTNSERTKNNLKLVVKMTFSMISLILSGVICIILNFII